MAMRQCSEMVGVMGKALLGYQLILLHTEFSPTLL